jgi:hypothetical protein
MTDRIDDPLKGLTTSEQEIMGRLLRTPHEQQKDAPKTIGDRAEAQRRRREKERVSATKPSHGP